MRFFFWAIKRTRAGCLCVGVCMCVSEGVLRMLINCGYVYKKTYIEMVVAMAAQPPSIFIGWL